MNKTKNKQTKNPQNFYFVGKAQDSVEKFK